MPSRMTVHKWFLRMQYELSLCLVSGGEGLDKELTTPQVSRPGLTLAGYFRHFDARQMQVLGQQEIAYVSDLAPARRGEIFRQMLDADMPCVVVTRGLEPPAELVEESRRAGTAVLSTKMPTGSFIARTIVYLEEEFGPSEVLHANLAEVYGVGVLIQGKSGIGKSECMLELVKRGHRFVADDSVVLKHITGHRVVGTSAHPLKYYMEVRGIGIISVVTIFGVTAVRSHKRVGLVATLVGPDEYNDEGRTGLDQEEVMLMGEMLPHVRVPVRAGRSPAVLVEVATMDFLARRMGHYAAREFDEALLRQIESGQEPGSAPFGDWDDQADF
ncbi:HPr(Ser) kinase/phosphatase [Candidatus Poribacteria bacterium]|nr:HPr(Ser) kinase/phosphatase [Candidatus Poribacteria bacterium]MBT7100054.1 HPr(Ser) kinase/phosphatase [Candidatus Poribacteria bacterium]